MPCEERQALADIETAACCATPSLAPSAIQALSEQQAIDLPALDSTAGWAVSPARPSSSSCAYYKCSTDPPQPIADRSLTYLQTARLRL